MELKVLTPSWDVHGIYYLVSEATAAEKVATQDDMDEGPYSYCQDEGLCAKIIATYEDLAGDFPKMANTDDFAMATFSDCWYLAEINLF